MTARDNILARIRAARGIRGPILDAERAEIAADLAAPQAGPALGWDEAAVARFHARAEALSTTLDGVGALEAVPAAAARYLKAGGLPFTAVVWRSLLELNWAGAGITVAARPARGGDLVGITGAFCAIAETGTLMTLSGAERPPSVSLVPETHIAVLPAQRIVRTMEDAWALLRRERPETTMPRAVNFISGPSRTADIEQTLVLGAHGPYRVHIILIGG
ncbi:MAG: LutC/YkgG family protein [Burkholderiales bacterium]